MDEALTALATEATRRICVEELMLEMPWKELSLLCIGGMVATIGFVLQRYIRGDAASERLDRRSRVLELHERLRSENLTVEDVDKLEEKLAGRRKRRFELENEVAARMLGSSYEPRPGETQSEINELAGADMALAETALQKAYLELSFHLNPLEAENLEKAKKAWRKFAEAEARFLASSFEGGSMQSGVYSTEMESLLIRRIAEVKGYIEDWPSKR